MRALLWARVTCLVRDLLTGRRAQQTARNTLYLLILFAVCRVYYILEIRFDIKNSLRCFMLSFRLIGRKRPTYVWGGGGLRAPHVSDVMSLGRQGRPGLRPVLGGAPSRPCSTNNCRSAPGKAKMEALTSLSGDSVFAHAVVTQSLRGYLI